MSMRRLVDGSGAAAECRGDSMASRRQPFPTDRCARWTSRTACSRRAATCRPSACSTPTAQASFPGTATGSRSCGGVPTRAWCLFVDEFKVSRSLRKTVAAAALRDPRRHRVRGVMRGCAAPRDGQEAAPGSRRDDRAPIAGCTSAVTRIRSRPGATAPGRRPVRRGDRPHVLRRIDVRARDRRVQGRAGASGRVLRRRGMPLIDCQQETAHLASFGARPIPRRAVCGAMSRDW